MRSSFEEKVEKLISELDSTLADESESEGEYGDACAMVASHFEVAADAAGGKLT